MLSSFPKPLRSGASLHSRQTLKPSRAMTRVKAAFNPSFNDPSHNSPTQNGIFQGSNLPFIDNTSVFDARDAMECCNVCANPEEKAACYAIFGLESGPVESYYDIVFSLENALYNAETEPIEEALHHGQERC